MELRSPQLHAQGRAGDAEEDAEDEDGDEEDGDNEDEDGEVFI